MKNLRNVVLGLCFTIFSIQSSFADDPFNTSLRCFYREKASNLTPLTKYVWAFADRSSNGCDGVTKNGCYLIHGYWLDNTSVTSNMFYTDTTQDELNQICKNALRKARIKMPVAMVAAGASDLSTHYTLWTNDTREQDNKLNKIISFGDSLSDTHNLFNHSTWKVPVPDNYYAGRFSNGKNWLDYFSSDLNLPAYNWAVGGAGVIKQYGILPGIGSQVDSWIKYMKKAINYHPENTLFTVLIGGNDLIYYGLGVDTMISSEEIALQKLIDNHGKNILLVNLPDVSLAPIFKFLGTEKQLEVRAQVTDYNEKLTQLVTRLQEKNKDVNIHVFDVYSMLDNLLKNPEKYAITNTQDSCLLITENNNLTFTVKHKTSPECSNAPNKADSYVFWDLIHPTSHTHKLLSDNAYCFAYKEFGSLLNSPKPGTSLPDCNNL